MPRSRRQRTIGAEDHLAARVRHEMSRRRLSYNQLAVAMGQQGVDMSGSSLQKSFTDSVDPGTRRPIRVDELVALARVFETSVENLLAPRDWVDQEQVDHALGELDHADRLLVETVQIMLDAQITLVRATTGVPPEVVQEVLGQTTTYWWATSPHTRLSPSRAPKTATPISAQAVGQRIAALKAVIHAIAVHWAQAEAAHLPAWQTRGQPLIGSTTWDRQLAAELTYYDEPEPDDHITTPEAAI